jgi:hypothetical protein
LVFGQEVRGPYSPNRQGAYTQQIRSFQITQGDVIFDLNRDNRVDDEDPRVWTQELKNTYFGDANLDGEFSSDDLLRVFQAGEYEDSVTANSSWSIGDWNGDREFTSSDLIWAFRDGGYETGPATEIAHAVPEPTTALWSIYLFAATIAYSCMRNSRRIG